MQKTFICISWILLLSLATAQDTDNGTNSEDNKIIPQPVNDPPIEVILYNLPDFLRVTGQASGNLQNEQVKIGLTIETLKQTAGDSLQSNSYSSTRAIANIKLLGLDKSEFATSGISIFPSYNSVYNPVNGTYTQIFEGYKVRNTITISTQKLTLAGKIIDAAIQSGVNNVDYITFSPLDTSIQALKEQLLSAATNNASKQANIVLGEVGYEIKSVKSINLTNNNYNPQPYYNLAEAAMPAADMGSSAPTQTFEGSSTVNVSVDVSFIIGKKGESE